jgi:AP2 domain
MEHPIELLPTHSADLEGGHRFLIIDKDTGAAVLTIVSAKYGEFRVLIDQEDWERVSLHNWSVHHVGNDRFYFGTKRMPTGGNNLRLLHRLIMNAPVGVDVDHKFNNYTDCRKDQLQCVSTQRNMQKARRRRGTSQFRGVFFRSDRNRWIASIRVNRKSLYIAYCDSELEAAIAYDAKARELNASGHSYALNFPQRGEYAA